PEARKYINRAQGYVKIDFRLYAEGIGIGDRVTGVCGTTHYMAPELFSLNNSTRSLDWWSLGAIVYEMLLGEVSVKLTV
ncbi:hypothetical protein GDO86_000598, partial [Hymenochirus boettgeri]